jgi:hypothetical protein
VSAEPVKAAPGPAEPGSGALTVTDVPKPSVIPVSWAARLAWLHLRSRRVPAALVALLACGAALSASLRYHWWLGTGNGADELPMILQGCAAGIVAVTAHSPFGEPERATGRRLPLLRAGRALADTGRFMEQDVSLRWIYVHMIEEYARHNGHADLLRERIDGATGV